MYIVIYMQVPAQTAFLESHVVPFAIGTPNRINKLLDLGKSMHNLDHNGMQKHQE